MTARAFVLAIACTLGTGCGLAFVSHDGSAFEVNPGQLQHPDAVTFTSGLRVGPRLQAAEYGLAIDFWEWKTLTAPVTRDAAGNITAVPTIITSTGVGVFATHGQSTIGDVLIIGNPGPIFGTPPAGLQLAPLDLHLGVGSRP